MKKSITFLIILLLTNVPSLYYSLYINITWLDTVQHFMGGFLIAMLFSEYLKYNFREGRPIQNVLILVGATIFIGVVWEFLEYIANQTLVEPIYRKFQIRAYFMGDLEDTIKDMANDIMGAFVASLIFLRHRKSN